MSVIVLTTNPAKSKLDTGLVSAIHAETGGNVNWLHHNVAAEISDPKAAQPLLTAKALIGDSAVDINIVPHENRRKKLLVADMDSTMINEECIDELGSALGLGDQIALITERAMRGEMDFEEALDMRVRLLEGLSVSVLKQVRRERVSYAAGGRVLVQTMKTCGAFTALVSGGFSMFADHVARRIGFDQSTANILELENDMLTGSVARPIVDGQTKRDIMNRLVTEKGLTMADTLAVGDGANDLTMLEAASMGVAMHAKPKVAARARYRLDHSDLAALLYLQGYTEEELVRI